MSLLPLSAALLCNTEVLAKNNNKKINNKKKETLLARRGAEKQPKTPSRLRGGNAQAPAPGGRWWTPSLTCQALAYRGSDPLLWAGAGPAWQGTWHGFSLGSALAGGSWEPGEGAQLAGEKPPLPLLPSSPCPASTGRGDWGQGISRPPSSPPTTKCWRLDPRRARRGESVFLSKSIRVNQIPSPLSLLQQERGLLSVDKTRILVLPPLPALAKSHRAETQPPCALQGDQQVPLVHTRTQQPPELCGIPSGRWGQPTTPSPPVHHITWCLGSVRVLDAAHRVANSVCETPFPPPPCTPGCPSALLPSPLCSISALGTYFTARREAVHRLLAALRSLAFICPSSLQQFLLLIK